MAASTQTPPINDTPLRVFVAGATGGVGQLIVGKLIEQKIPVRAMTRVRSKAEQMFGDRAEIAIADSRTPQTLESAMTGITHIICCTGTTAFPSERWEFNFAGMSEIAKVLAWGRLCFDREYRQQLAQNGPHEVDTEGVKALIQTAPPSLQQFILVSSVGITRRDQLPFSILNSFGVLDAKARGEEALIQSTRPYTIIRPGRLMDGPFTSFDLNTLLKATTDGKQGIEIGTGDILNGETSRIDVANACVAALNEPHALNQIFEIINTGKRPPQINWSALFHTMITPTFDHEGQV